MNAGMHGMADGRGFSDRKVTGSFGDSAAGIETGFLSASPFAGMSVYSTTTVSNVPKLLAKVTGKGAVKFVAFQRTPGSTNTLTLVIDGRKISQTTVGTASTFSTAVVGKVAVPTASAYVPIFDFVPFEASAELYVTTDAGGTSYFVFHGETQE